ncbi:MAG: hypothetical protein ACPH4I_04865 [Flavobacteriaceae bacterium]
MKLTSEQLEEARTVNIKTIEAAITKIISSIAVLSFPPHIYVHHIDGTKY